MKATSILYDSGFEKEYKTLPKNIKEKAEKARKLFLENAFHPSLRLHKLSGKLEGLWSISLDKKYRIIFMPLEDGKVPFVSIGTHAIYE